MYIYCKNKKIETGEKTKTISVSLIKILKYIIWSITTEFEENGYFLLYFIN